MLPFKHSVAGTINIQLQLTFPRRAAGASHTPHPRGKDSSVVPGCGISFLCKGRWAWNGAHATVHSPPEFQAYLQTSASSESWLLSLTRTTVPSGKGLREAALA